MQQNTSSKLFSCNDATQQQQIHFNQTSSIRRAALASCFVVLSSRHFRSSDQTIANNNKICHHIEFRIIIEVAVVVVGAVSIVALLEEVVVVEVVVVVADKKPEEAVVVGVVYMRKPLSEEVEVEEV